MEFCKAFNAATDGMDKGTPTPTIITVYADKSFSFITKTPPATYLIKKAANLKSGSKEPGKISGGKIARSKLAEIAEIKMKDLNANDIEQATKIIEGSARRSEEHTSELQSLMRISYAVFCLKKKKLRKNE